ncbi:hypothetical protein Tco_0879447 [Tanacetum coccineum]
MHSGSTFLRPGLLPYFFPILFSINAVLTNLHSYQSNLLVTCPYQIGIPVRVIGFELNTCDTSCRHCPKPSVLEGRIEITLGDLSGYSTSSYVWTWLGI